MPASRTRTYRPRPRAMPAFAAVAVPVFMPMSRNLVPSHRAATASPVPSLEPLSTTVARRALIDVDVPSSLAEVAADLALLDVSLATADRP